MSGQISQLDRDHPKLSDGKFELSLAGGEAEDSVHPEEFTASENPHDFFLLWQATAPRRSPRVPKADLRYVVESQKPRIRSR